MNFIKLSTPSLVFSLTRKSNPIVDGRPDIIRSHLRSSSLFCLSYKQFASMRQFIWLSSLAGGTPDILKLVLGYRSVTRMLHAVVSLLTEEKYSPIIDGIPYIFRSHLRSSSLFCCLSYKQFASKRQFICPISA